MCVMMTRGHERQLCSGVQLTCLFRTLTSLLSTYFTEGTVLILEEFWKGQEQTAVMSRDSSKTIRIICMISFHGLII